MIEGWQLKGITYLMEQAYLKNLQHFLSLSRKHIWIESHHHTPSDRRGVEVSDGCGLGWQRAEAGTPDDEGRGVAHRGSGPIQHLRGLLHGAPIYRVSKPSFLICKMDITIPLTQSCFLGLHITWGTFIYIQVLDSFICDLFFSSGFLKNFSFILGVSKCRDQCR